MPIIDYEKTASQALANLLNDKQISKVNKDNLNKFLDPYDVSHARLGIFFRHITPLLRATEDIKAAMHNKETINKIFKDFRTKLSTSYYATIINVSLRFVRWLNDGERPKGFSDIKNMAKAKQRRNLKADDMITWADGLKIINETNSVQLKAVIMAQLDGGFRPSEFIDMKYGDCKVQKNFIIANVNGKTGQRDVVLFRCCPFLQRWLTLHPTKKAKDPLWIMEYPNKSKQAGKTIRYNYPGLQKRVRELIAKAGIDKPSDFYNLRHSACTISKLDNVNSGLAAEKFGHTVEYYERTYGRLDTTGKMKRYAKVYNLEATKKKDADNPRFCERCETMNEATSDVCEKCNSPLTMDKALESHNKMEKMEEELSEIKRLMKAYGLMQKKK